MKGARVPGQADPGVEPDQVGGAFWIGRCGVLVEVAHGAGCFPNWLEERMSAISEEPRRDRIRVIVHAGGVAPCHAVFSLLIPCLAQEIGRGVS
jgi:hypothetical protein